MFIKQYFLCVSTLINLSIFSGIILEKTKKNVNVAKDNTAK